MTILRSPGEGGYTDREAKVPLHELPNWGNALVANTSRAFQVRCSIGDKSRTFFRFAKIPTIPVEFPVPELDAERYNMDGWDHLAITLNIEKDMASLDLQGRFGRDDNAMIVHATLVRNAVNETKQDSLIIEKKDGEMPPTSIFDLMQVRSKSGDPRYARFSDQYPLLDVEGVAAMVTRYVKELRSA
ncbi:MAG: hypothetical protein CVU59_07165 [Deltaproteobacteria bacterium HGW-Deltaproteobacteria-17]|nr:MAG: hypothetical protein CVU59_07165 [Deltaproteobacteria bacterium HGW-Deltaproteobacteria-17]